METNRTADHYPVLELGLGLYCLHCANTDRAAVRAKHNCSYLALRPVVAF